MSKTLVIELNEKEAEHLEALAREGGYQTSSDYLRAVIQALSAHEVDERNLRESIKHGLREALRGEYIPLDRLWADDDE